MSTVLIVVISLAVLFGAGIASIKIARTVLPVVVYLVAGVIGLAIAILGVILGVIALMGMFS